MNEKHWKGVALAAIIMAGLAMAAAAGAWVKSEKVTESQKKEEVLESETNTDNISVSTSGWAGKTWCSYGDSITGYNVWQPYVTQYFGFATHYERGLGSSTYTKSDQTWYANPDGSYNSRYGFAGVTEAPEGTTTHEGYLCSWDRITTMIPQDVDLVVIMAGTNDAGPSVSAPLGDLTYPFDEETFMGAVASTVVKIQEWCPNATVVLATPFSGRGAYEEGMTNEEMAADQTEPVYNQLGLTTEDYAKAVMEVAEYLSVPCIDVFGNCGVNQFNRSAYLEDLVHPNQAGGEAIARVIIGGLKAIEPLH